MFFFPSFLCIRYFFFFVFSFTWFALCVSVLPHVRGRRCCWCRRSLRHSSNLPFVIFFGTFICVDCATDHLFRFVSSHRTVSAVAGSVRLAKWSSWILSRLVSFCFVDSILSTMMVCIEYIFTESAKHDAADGEEMQPKLDVIARWVQQRHWPRSLWHEERE